jgi:hypothetical protein
MWANTARSSDQSIAVSVAPFPAAPGLQRPAGLPHGFAFGHRLAEDLKHGLQCYLRVA